MRSSQSRKESLIRRFGNPECKCANHRCGSCEYVGRCARDAVLSAGRDVIRELEGFGFRQKEVAGIAGVHRTALNKWQGNSDDPRLGLERLVEALDKMRQELVVVGQKFLTKAVVTQAVPLKTVDFCSPHGIPDQLRSEAQDIVSANLLSAIANRPLSANRKLPKGVYATLSQVGDPGYQMWVVVVADPECTEETTARIETYDNIIHELEHIVRRYKDQRDQLTQGVRNSNPRSLRLS